jgi:hypothetical protein
MKQALKYSLKVWLTSCIVVPLVWAVGFQFIYSNNQPFSPTIFLSVLFIIAATILTSFITWLAFYLSIIGILRYSLTHYKLKILLTGEAVIVITFIVFMKAFPGFDQKVYLVNMACHCLVIGLGIWLYKLKLLGTTPNIEPLT